MTDSHGVDAEVADSDHDVPVACSTVNTSLRYLDSLLLVLLLPNKLLLHSHRSIHRSAHSQLLLESTSDREGVEMPVPD